LEYNNNYNNNNKYTTTTTTATTTTATNNKPNPRHACLHRQNALSKLCVRANARAPNGELVKERKREGE